MKNSKNDKRVLEECGWEYVLAGNRMIEAADSIEDILAHSLLFMTDEYGWIIKNTYRWLRLVGERWAEVGEGMQDELKKIEEVEKNTLNHKEKCSL